MVALGCSPQNPLSYQEVQDKFRAVARNRIPQDAAEAIIEAVDQLDALQDVREMTSHLVLPESVARVP